MPDFDILVWGATGFTGRLVCEHILANYQTSLRWAMGGRNKDKLESTRQELSGRYPGALDVSILVADMNDKDSLFKLASSTNVLLSTAGPYIHLGTPVIRACLQAKTHYADINGELEWMRQTIEEFHEPAKKAGVKIVHSCGWDCAPADLGVLFLAEHTEKALQRKLAKVTNLVTDIAGSFSGGTLNTALGFYKHPFVSLFPHPYSLNPAAERYADCQAQQLLAERNVRYVWKGVESLPPEVQPPLKMPSQSSDAVVQISFLTRWLKAKSLKPGEGPSREVMEEGHWRCDLIGSTEERTGKPKLVRAVLQGRGDPGYLQTSRMLLEAGMCLLKGESGQKCLKGGVLTPAAGLGTALIDRLIAAGISFRVLETDGKPATKLTEKHA